eukprot:9503916-Pyramimonas_sp.AAC.1
MGIVTTLRRIASGAYCTISHIQSYSVTFNHIKVHIWSCLIRRRLSSQQFDRRCRTYVAVASTALRADCKDLLSDLANRSQVDPSNRSPNPPIRHRKCGYILTTDQSVAFCGGMCVHCRHPPRLAPPSHQSPPLH